MLRIKDNVDLKELEKFGFKKGFHDGEYGRIIKKDEITSQCLVYISKTINPITATIPKFLYIATPLSITPVNKNNTWVIDDLIKADLVEKVEE